MPDDKKLDKTLEKFFIRFNKYNTKVLVKLGETIGQFSDLTPSEAQILAQKLKYGNDIDELVTELAIITNQSIDDVYTVLDKVAEENVAFSEIYYKAKNKEFINYKDNESLKRLVNAISNETAESLYNLSRTNAVGFTLKDELTGLTQFKPLKQLYDDVIDEAVYNVSQGVTDYGSSMRNVIRQLADSGVKTHEEKVGFISGYNRRIDSQVRQNVLTAIRQVNMDIQEQVGEQFGADGVEISAHSPCAEDHLPIQGKQYSTAAFERLNGNLERPIGEYNCRHFIFSIVLGVSRPSYSNKLLNSYKRESNSKVEYEGKEYTKYEATQVQRQLETKIRQYKDRQIIARASGDKEEIEIAQNQIKKITEKYVDFSNKAKLPVYKDRLTVSGYRKVSTK